MFHNFTKHSSIRILICPAKLEIIKALIPTTLENYYLNINLTNRLLQTELPINCPI
jgi:hypothetical protein